MMKSLGVLLQQRSVTELGAMATRWGAQPVTSDDPAEVQRLERQMRDSLSARTVWQGLDPAERAVLLAIVGPAARNWCVIEQLPTRTDLPAEAVTAAYARLLGAFII
ncbi:MAG: hypothetical protein H0X24_22390, partial [Ktedonobacterales bacterium]|nr:hypothetical protein [Ktedonobacterales bacterium]